MVYEDAEKIYAEVKKEGKALLEEAFGTLLQRSYSIDSDAPFQASSPGMLVGFNTTMFPRLDVVKVSLKGSGGSQLKSKVVQTSGDGTSGYALMHSEGGLGASFSRGLFADCHAASG